MLSREIRNKRNQLYDMSHNLQILALYEKNYEKGRKLKEEQNKVYKRWKFFDGLIKQMEK